FRSGFGRHAVRITLIIHTCQVKNTKMHETLLEKSRARLISCGDLSFAPETRLGATLPVTGQYESPIGRQPPCADRSYQDRVPALSTVLHHSDNLRDASTRMACGRFPFHIKCFKKFSSSDRSLSPICFCLWPYEDISGS